MAYLNHVSLAVNLSGAEPATGILPSPAPHMCHVAPKNPVDGRFQATPGVPAAALLEGEDAGLAGDFSGHSAAVPVGVVGVGGGIDIGEGHRVEMAGRVLHLQKKSVKDGLGPFSGRYLEAGRWGHIPTVTFPSPETGQHESLLATLANTGRHSCFIWARVIGLKVKSKFGVVVEEEVGRVGVNVAAKFVAWWQIEQCIGDCSLT